MEQLDENQKKKYIYRLLHARFRLLNDNCFYGLLLMNTKFGLDLKCETAYTDGNKICFSPKFMDELSDSELEFVLMHETLHIVLKHCRRGRKLDNYLFNIACDIVVNSNILKSNNMDLSKITLKKYGEAIHLAPNGNEGYEYSAEEVYQMLIDDLKNKKIISFDNHDHWNQTDEDMKKWDERLVSTISVLNEIDKHRTKIPLGALRIFNNLINPQINWKEILREFLSTEVCDYSFTKPDKRIEGEFFMPDFAEEEEVVKINVVFAIDTSSSISDEQLSSALVEVKSAIDESRNLNGYVICLDAKTYDPVPINEFDINSFKALGGGGTSFIEFFKQLDELKLNLDNKIDLIIFITDGYDDFPSESVSQNIPTLWIINNNDVTPPWGMVARIDVDNN